MPSGFRRHLVGKTHINVFHIPYQLRNRSHNITLINKTKSLNDTDLIIRMLYKYSYWHTICNLSIYICSYHLYKSLLGKLFNAQYSIVVITQHCIYTNLLGYYIVPLLCVGCVWQPPINEHDDDDDCNMAEIRLVGKLVIIQAFHEPTDRMLFK